MAARSALGWPNMASSLRSTAYIYPAFQSTPYSTVVSSMNAKPPLLDRLRGIGATDVYS